MARHGAADLKPELCTAESRTEVPTADSNRTVRQFLDSRRRVGLDHVTDDVPASRIKRMANALCRSSVYARTSGRGIYVPVRTDIQSTEAVLDALLLVMVNPDAVLLVTVKISL